MPTYTSEKDVKAQIKKLLGKHGWFYWMPPANGYGKSGIADILAIKDGVFVAIEAKFGKNKPSPMQSAFLMSIKAESGFGFVVNDKNIEWLDTWLTAFARAQTAIAAGEKIADGDGPLMLDAIHAMTALI